MPLATVRDNDIASLPMTNHQAAFPLDQVNGYQQTQASIQTVLIAQDATRTQNSMFGIRNLRKPRELSQPNQLDMVGERGFEPPTPWSRRLVHEESTL